MRWCGMAKTVISAHPDNAVEAPPSLWRQALDDLRPCPGRAGLTWRIALLCALVTGAGMMYEIPEAAISCYLIIFLMKPDAVVNIGTGIGLLVLLPGLIAFLVWVVNLTNGSTLHIMAAIVITSCLLLYLGAATQLGEHGGVAALIIAFVLTLIVQAPFGDVATFALREAWAMAALPMILRHGRGDLPAHPRRECDRRVSGDCNTAAGPVGQKPQFREQRSGYDADPRAAVAAV